MATVEDTNDFGTFVDDDVVVFGQNGTAVTQNNDQSANLDVNGLAGIIVTPQHLANIGTAGSPLIATVSEDVNTRATVRNEGGGGRMFYQPSSGEDCDVYQQMGRMSGTLTDENFINVEALTMDLLIEDPVTLTNLRVGGAANVTLANTGSDNAPALIEVGGGILNDHRGLANSGTGRIYGGVWVLDSDSTMGTGTTIDLLGGDLRLVRPGTLPTVNWRGGGFNLDNLAVEVVISQLNYWGSLSERSIDRLFNHPLVTVSNNTRFMN